MVRVVMDIDVPPGAEEGIKEQISTDFEKYGDVRVISVTVREPEQLQIGGETML